MTHTRPTKAQLETALKLTKQIVDTLPPGDSMRSMYEKMVKRLTDRIKTYDKFLINPYTTTANRPKFNSDTSLGLGGYVAAKEED